MAAIDISGTTLVARIVSCAIWLFRIFTREHSHPHGRLAIGEADEIVASDGDAD